LKALIIGIGSIGKRHIEVIRTYYPSITIYALRSSTKSVKIGGVKDFFSLNEVSFKPDFIIISNPTSLHEKTIIDCISFRAPLFIEKPVLSNLKNGNKILDLIKKNNIVSYVGCNMRFHPALVYLKNNFKKYIKNICEVNIYCGSYLPNWRKNSDFRKSYSSMPEMGGGVNLDLIHEIDYCIWIFGKPKSVRSLKTSKSYLNIRSLDYCRFDLMYDSFNASINLNYFRKDSKRELEIVTEKDTLVVDLLNNTIFSKIDNKFILNDKFNLMKSYEDQFKYFFNCVQNNKDTFNNFEFGLDTLKIALNE
jgi:predicted dehydrogenase